MSGKIVSLDEARHQRQHEEAEDMRLFLESLPLSFSAEHCAEARDILGWSVEALAFRSGVSTKAIRGLELGSRKLRSVTLQALAFSFEAEGLIFFSGMRPMKGENCRGGTSDPRVRNDYHLLE